MNSGKLKDTKITTPYSVGLQVLTICGRNQESYFKMASGKIGMKLTKEMSVQSKMLTYAF